MDLPTIVLGDPMQAIFGFQGNQLVDWNAHVETQFPQIGTLATPWRWRNSGTEALGLWLLEARGVLQRRQGVNLRTAPPEVQWVQLDAATANQQRRTAAQIRTTGDEETVLIIGDALNVRGRHELSSQTPGASSVESVDLGDLVAFARRFDMGAADAMEQLVRFPGELVTKVNATHLIARVATLRGGRPVNPPTLAEEAAVAFAQTPTSSAALQLLHQLEEQTSARVFRPEILRCLKSSLRTVAVGGTTLYDAVVRARERNRHLSRTVARRSVGSTLLLKGLEADIAVITHSEEMDAPNLCVALTRGARRLVVCSSTPLLVPEKH